MKSLALFARLAVVAASVLVLPSCTAGDNIDKPRVGTTRQALDTQFGPGSLIIPMGNNYQDNGMVRAYGLVYALIKANVPVQWIVSPTKVVGGDDFTLDSTQTVIDHETSAAISAPRSYRGGPFVIAPGDRAVALPVINAWLAADAVTVVHDLTAGSFTANVAKTLSAAPIVAVFEDGNEQIAYADLAAANILDTDGKPWTQASPHSFSVAEIQGPTQTNHADGVLLSNGIPTVSFLTSEHYATPDAEVVSEVRAWLAAGPVAHAYMQCEAINAFENMAPAAGRPGGRYLSTKGLTIDNLLPSSTTSDLAPNLTGTQIDGKFTADNGSGARIVVPNGSALDPGVLTTFTESNPANIVQITGHLDGNPQLGKVTYLTGHKYSTAEPVSKNPLTNGARLFFDAILDSPGAVDAGQPKVMITALAPASTTAGTITFTLNYTNTGTAAAFGVNLTDNVPAGTTFASASAGGTQAGGVVAWPIGIIPPGGSGSVTFTVNVAADGTITNQGHAAFNSWATARTADSNTTTTVRDTTAPDTTIVSGPPATTSATTADFTFSSSEPGSTFECSLDGAVFATCMTPTSLAGLAVGQHNFAVRAVDALGNVDATPATATWNVVAGGGGDAGGGDGGSGGGCTIDAQCTNAEFCDTSKKLCTPKLTNGTGIPTIANHDPVLNGLCSGAVGTSVCVSSVCDTDKACGFANGDGPCNAANGGTVCRSGACSANTGICIPASGGCAVDADCASNAFCDTSLLACTPKLTNGTSVPTIGGHNPPLAGACTAAAGASVCIASVCDIDNRCGFANGDGLCDGTNATTVCRSGLCSIGKVCIGPGMCTVDADCTSSQFCNTATSTCILKLGNNTPVPTIAGHAPTLDGTCTGAVGAAVCIAGICDTDNKCGYQNGDGPCDAQNAGTVCRSAACAAGVCTPPVACTTDAQCTKAQFCNTATSTCTPKLGNGTGVPTISGHTPPLTGTCNSDVGMAVCIASFCDTNDNACGYAIGDGPCTRNNGGTVCRSGLCSASKVCIGPGTCKVDADCSSAQFCNTSSSTCTNKLPNGTTVPTIGGHAPPLTGACSAAVGDAVCASSVCDANDNACGYANGDGPCTPANATTVCRTQACGAGGLCAPPPPCTTDAQCAASEFCNTSTSKCTAKLLNGTVVPTISGHTPPLVGMCSATVAVAVCSSSVCDTNDSACGYANGDGPCDAASASAVCRSTTCSSSNVCIAAGSCKVDADCASTSFCNTATSACVDKLANGTAVPTIAGHAPPLAGTCSPAASAAVCVSAVCDTNDNACGYANGDGRCNDTNGATVCRSAACAPNGLCAAPAPCTTDAQCTSTQFCNTAASICTPKLTNGKGVPTIGGHTPPLTGTCTPEAGGAVCFSGVCDATDDNCGFTNGHGSCNPGNAGTVCRSGSCARDGTCGSGSGAPDGGAPDSGTPDAGGKADGGDAGRGGSDAGPLTGGSNDAANRVPNSLEGGGLGCTMGPNRSAPLDFVAGIFSVLGLATSLRRRRRRRN